MERSTLPVPTLLAAGAIAAIVASSYAYVAWSLGRRSAGDPSRRALAHFALWWGALAANLAGVAITYVLAAFDALTLPAQLTASHVQRLLLAVSMTGLVSYLLFVLTGRDHARRLAFAYAAYYVLSLYAMMRAQPTGVFVGNWRTDLVYAAPSPVWVGAVNLLVIVLPPLACGVAFAFASRRAGDATQRYRMRVVAFAVVFWWAVAVAAGQRALLDVDAVQAAHRVLSLLAALLVLAAYRPPGWARRRFGVEALA